jgi:hypothetical protein
MVGMTVQLIRYDAARKALNACHRVDEVKKIHDKATALLAYARQAGDLTLQNQAAEIRIFSERRAGQLLVDMNDTGQRQAKQNGRPRKVSSTTRVPKTLPELGITHDQSSKWQRLARLIDDETFERALLQAKEKYGELTTSGVLREVREVVRPKSRDVQPDINVIAAEIARELDSPTRRDRLDEVVRLRSRLNPTIRKQLIASVENASKHLATSLHSLSADFKQPTSNGKAHQRLIREHLATQPEADLEAKMRLAADFKNATVREISYDEAKNVITANEWLGNLGTTEWAYGLFFGEYLAGVVCFGSTAGTNVAASICGEEHRHKVTTLCRGACVHWAHPHSASYLITAACKEMTKKGCHIVVAYSDPEAGEVGTIYQACNFLYCGQTNPTEHFRRPDGKIYDAKQVSNLRRDHRSGTSKYLRSRAEQKQLMLEQGCEFFKGTPKHRYVAIYGDRRTKRVLGAALRWEVLPYPKRSIAEESVQARPVKVSA